MMILSLRRARIARTYAVLLCCSAFFSTSGWAQGEKQPGAGEKPAADKAAAEKTQLPPLPADAHTQQQMQLDGKTLKYTVTVGSLPVRDKDGKEAGDVVFTAYTVEGDNRPVTFAFNGGPGASSVFLNFGAIGPKHMNA
jgi:carboxypeptidase C (cathepsin A)